MEIFTCRCAQQVMSRNYSLNTALKALFSIMSLLNPTTTDKDIILTATNTVGYSDSTVGDTDLCPNIIFYFKYSTPTIESSTTPYQSTVR
jgi:hypothetical protein